MPTHTRRSFLRRTATAAAAIGLTPTILPASVLRRRGKVPAPSDRINLAFIGAGNQAGNDARGFLRDERVQISSICDVNAESMGYWNGAVAGRDPLIRRVEEAYTEKYGRPYTGVKGYEDFRELLEDDDIDAVVIDTPDHWHAIPVLIAAAKGKDIYCQKPLSLTVAEGRAMSNAAKHYDIVFQTGSQQRSSRYFRHTCELVLNGRIGKLHTVRCGLPGGTPDFGKTGYLTNPLPIPRGFNYDMWLGPAPEVPYCPARTHVNFRWILDYSGGQVTDWGGHHPDIAQWGMGTELTGPVAIRNAKAVWADHPVWDTAIEYHFECEYANGVRLIVSDKEKHGVRFDGSDGSVWATRRNFGASSEEIYYSRIGDSDVQLPKSDDHYRNFIDCVYTRETPLRRRKLRIDPSQLATWGIIAMKLGQDLKWDPKQERVVGNDAANNMLSRPMRAPWDKVYEKFMV